MTPFFIFKYILYMEKKIILLLGLLACFFFISCDKEVKDARETRFTTATVTSVHHRAAYTTHVRSGKATTTIHHPAQNIVRFSATIDGVFLEGSLNNRTLYLNCKDNIGCGIDARYDYRLYQKPDGSYYYTYSNLRVAWTND